MASFAVPHLEQSARRDPKNPLFQYHLGLALLSTGEKAKARRALDQALKLNPEGPFAEQVRNALATP